MKDSGASEQNVTLLVVECITVAGTLVQSTRAPTTVTFSNTNYWAPDLVAGTNINLNEYKIPATLTVDSSCFYDATGTKTITPKSIITIAKEYGTNLGGTGRLMTCEEAQELQTINSNLLYGKSANRGYLNYWLGSSRDGSRIGVWYVSGQYENLSYSSCNIGKWSVRPVVEISKSLIQ